RILVIAEPIHVLQKERNIGIVVPVFKPRKDPIFVFEFAGDRKFLDLLSHGAREAMLVVIVLPAGDEREPIIGLNLHVPSHAFPSYGSAAFLMPTVVVIPSEAELGRETVRCFRGLLVTPIGGGGSLPPA